MQGPPLGPRGSEALGLLQAEHQPLSSDGGRAFYSSHYHAERCPTAHVHAGLTCQRGAALLASGRALSCAHRHHVNPIV